jgi:uncharacterized membrane protein
MVDSTSPFSRCRRLLRRLGRDTGGLAAVEFALIGSTLIIGLFNAVDLGRYFYARMEVQNAAQMAAQAVWKNCAPPHLPASTSCTNWTTYATTGAQSTSLGASVTVATGYPAEGYWCVNGTGSIVYAAAIGAKPANCSAQGNAAGLPGDYVQIQTSYTYAPLFPALNVTGTLPTPITATTLMRLI